MSAPCRPSFVLSLAAAFAAGVAALWLAHKYWPESRTGIPADTFTPPAESRVPAGAMPVSAALSAEYARAVERVLPGVVSIQVRRRVIKEELIPKGGRLEPVERESIEPGIGSGAVISKEGHVVTNWHVVENADDDAILVSLSGEARPRRATLVDKDDQLDIALLRVESRHAGEQFTALRFGDSDKMKTGHLVLALGSPFGLRETVTSGMISHRERRVSDTLTAYLQTNCIINPGNSGGPLVNLEGDLIGIVTRKLLGPDETAASEGYGLAIPGNDVFEAVDRLRSKGRPRIYLGLQVTDWPERAWQQGDPSEAVMVLGVWKHSPAEKAGLQPGDIIESVGGTRVTSSAEYRRATRGHSVGDAIPFTWKRKDTAGEGTAVLEDFDKVFPPESTIKPGLVCGVKVRVLLRYERNLLHLYAPIGLSVESVAPDSPFAGILSPRTNILRVSPPDRTGTITDVATPDEFSAALKAVAATGGFLGVAATGEPDEWVEFPPLPPDAFQKKTD